MSCVKEFLKVVTCGGLSVVTNPSISKSIRAQCLPPTARASTLYQPNVKVVRLALLRIREVPSSNLSMKIGSPDG